MTKRITVTEEIQKRIILMAQRTWETCAHDIFQLVGKNSIRRNELIEIIQDADHMHYNGGDHDAYKFFLTLPGPKQISLMRDAFPDKTYGM